MNTNAPAAIPWHPGLTWDEVRACAPSPLLPEPGVPCDDGEFVNWAVEELLQGLGLFVSMHDGRPCHSDSYGTLIQFEHLDTAFRLVTEAMGERMRKISWIYWAQGASVNLRIVGSLLQRWLRLHRPDLCPEEPSQT